MTLEIHVKAKTNGGHWECHRKIDGGWTYEGRADCPKDKATPVIVQALHEGEGRTIIDMDRADITGTGSEFHVTTKGGDEFRVEFHEWREGPHPDFKPASGRFYVT